MNFSDGIQWGGGGGGPHTDKIKSYHYRLPIPLIYFHVGNHKSRLHISKT